MTTDAARDFLLELIGQLLHADLLITEQGDHLEALEAEVGRLRALLGSSTGAAS